MKVMLVLVRTLGDVILINNLVDGILKKFGKAEIDVYINEQYKCLIDRNKKISTIYTEKDWFSCWDKIIDIVSTGKYDEVMIPQQLNSEDNVWHQLEEYRHQHLVDFYLQRCRLPNRTKDEKLQIYSTVSDEVDVQKFISLNNIANYIVIHTTTLAPGKNWSKFQELTNVLLSEGIQVVQVGGKTDKLIEGVFDARELLTIPQLGLLADRAINFIGLDSGLSYVAAASGAKVIVIQGSTIPKTSGPWGDNVTNIVSKTLPECMNLRCHGNCRFPTGKCIDLISIDEVLSAINKK